jgi:hypothetical protein
VIRVTAARTAKWSNDPGFNAPSKKEAIRGKQEDAVVMETFMGRIEEHAVFYRGYQTDDRSLVPVTIVLATTVALWLLVYLIGAVGASQHIARSDLRPATATLQVNEAARR